MSAGRVAETEVVTYLGYRLRIGAREVVVYARGRSAVLGRRGTVGGARALVRADRRALRAT